MDGITLGAVVRELNHKLAGGRVDRVQQPERDEVSLTLRAQGGNHRLLLSSSPNHARLHLSKAAVKSPDAPPMFCQMLRKHLGGARFLKAEQMGADRVVTLRFEGLDELGDVAERRLILEIMGRHSNMILTDASGRILDSARHVTDEISRVREVLPGLPYAPPPAQDKLDPNQATAQDLIRLLSPKVGTRLDKALSDSLSGLSSQAAKELSYRIAGSEEATLTLALLPGAADKLSAFFARRTDAPTLLMDETGNPKDVTSFPYLSRDPSRQKAMPSMSEALEAFYLLRDRRERIAQKSHALRRTLLNALERCEKKRAIQLQTLKDAKNMDELRKKGDLLTASLHLVPKGAAMTQVPDYYAPDMGMVSIPLNPALSPAENAQRYYKQYNKRKAAADLAVGQLAQNEAEIRYLEGQLDDLEKCTTVQELGEIREELTRLHYLKPQAGNKKERIPPSKPLRFLSTQGIEIYVGKNNVQNDRLTFSAGPDETWLHAKDMPGSHVIVRSTHPDAGTLREAAQLAAYFSRGKRSANVPVDQTLRKYVKKPSGAKPGFVIYTHQTTLFVTPEEALVQRLAAQD